jgi:Uncharacterized alpha/beta hydrolase domain (DUF2235)
MATPIIGYLSAAEVATQQETQVAMAKLGGSTSPAPKFVFFGAFDGTNNNYEGSLSGDPYPTNIVNLFDQAKLAAEGSESFKTKYYPGVGTGGQNGNIIHAAINPTGPVHFAAESALNDFATQAQKYLKDNPTSTYADLSASAVGFSRGAGTAIVFAKLLNERGLLVNGVEIAPPGAVKVNGLALLDPVFSSMKDEMAIPSNVRGQVMAVRALDEFRTDFKAADFSKDGRVTTFTTYGNHCGVGGGYDLNGTAASVLQGVTGYLRHNGVAIAEVPTKRQFDPKTPTAIYTEIYQTARNGDITTNEDGSPKAKWPTQGSRGSRLTTLVGTPVDTPRESPKTTRQRPTPDGFTPQGTVLHKKMKEEFTYGIYPDVSTRHRNVCKFKARPQKCAKRQQR